MNNMSTQDQQVTALIVTVVGLAIAYLIIPKPKAAMALASNESIREESADKRKKMKAPTMSKTDAKNNPTAVKAFTVLKAYIAAYNAGEKQSVLDELNEEAKKQYGMIVYRQRASGRLAVKDLDDKDIIINEE